MISRFGRAGAVAAALILPGLAHGQRTAVAAADTIVVEGHHRVRDIEILGNSGLAPHRPVSFRELQRSIQALYSTGHFEEVTIVEDIVDGRTRLIIRVRERPLVLKWSVKGVSRLSEGKIRDQIGLIEGRALDPGVVAHSIAQIDSTYKAAGYYLARTKPVYAYESDSSGVRVVFEVNEGHRVAIARIIIEGNTHFTDEAIVEAIKSKPEGFFWFQNGAFDDDKLAEDLRERLPALYGRNGYADFQVIKDTIIVNDTTGKASLVLHVSEGDLYRVGSFEAMGNRKFTTEQIEALYPFAQPERGGFLGLGGLRLASYFDRVAWETATTSVQQAYYNEGYVYVNVRPEVHRRVDAQGNAFVDLRWIIQEGQPAIVSRVEIRGNDITHERVIRDAIVLVPGDVFRQNALIQSYQNVSNLGFFEQPLPPPETRPNQEGDLDIIFQVTERRTGNVNFGATIGQGTGLGGFIGLDETNLFGQGKRGRFQWQFGKNVNDFEIQYSDPTLFESRVSGTLTLYNRRVRYQIADLGRLKRVGGSIQFGFPLLADRYTRFFVNYSLDQQTFIGSATNIAFSSRFVCQTCVRSTIGVSLMRDRRVDLPFATAGSMSQIAVSQSGGPLGGTGNFQKIELEGRWYAPLGQLGGSNSRSPIKFMLGLTTRTGFVFGDSPFFEQLFSMGGTQFGIPLRGYAEFSITPRGFDPFAETRGASPNAVGKSFFLWSGELGMRVSQGLYTGLFIDAGNVWADASHFNPMRLFRGAGVGISFVSPLGPLGLDWAYGFDRVDGLGRADPAWKFHFRLGQPF